METGVGRPTEVSAPHSAVLWYYAVIVGSGALVLAASVFELVQHPPEASWYVLVVLTAISGSASVRLSDLPVSVSMSDTFILAAALIFGAEAATVTVAVDALAMSRRLRFVRPQQAIRRIAFNVSSPVLSLWAAAHVAFQLTGLTPITATPIPGHSIILPLLVFGSIYFAFNTGTVATIIALEHRSSVWLVWRDAFAPLWPAYVGGACLAGVLAGFTAAGVIDAAALALVLVLVLVLHLTYGAALTRLHRQVEHLQQLASYGEALRSTTDGVVVTNGEGIITFINAAAIELTGWSAAEAEGLPLEAVYRVAGAESASGEERLLMTRESGTRPVEQRCSPVVNARGARVGQVITFRDITQRKVHEAERAQLLDRAEAASQLKDEFLRALSHELRTPVTAVLGWARLLREGRLQGDAVQNALASLERNAHSQAAVVEALLELAAGPDGAPSVPFEIVDVRGPVNAAVVLMREAINAKGISVLVGVPPEPALVLADPDRLRQAVGHVLSNAVKFSPPTGTIHVGVAAQRNGRVVISVTDSGEGIDPSVLPFIFERFRQGDGTTTRLHRGLGIGLTIVQHIVELHRGVVIAESRGRGLGACFRIELPAHHADD